MINELLSITSDDTGVAFIYFSYSEAKRQNETNILGCVIQQLFTGRQELTEKLKEVHGRHSRTQTPPSMDEYMQLLQAAAIQFRDIFIIINALDQCNQDMKDTVLKKIHNTLPNARYLITSRIMFTSPSSAESATTFIDIQANEQDIKHYLCERFKICTSLQVHIERHDDLQERIVSGVYRTTNGM